MANMDTVIRGGTVIDGTGRAAYRADVALHEGKIAAIEPRLNVKAQHVIDAVDCIVSPGFVDVHTHYDAQLTWDDAVEPSASHGVTTIVVGNCGVGFAPVRPSQHQTLIDLMEGVEDIPGTALHEGIRWEWENFSGYLDALARRHFSMDVAALVPHGALRTFVMGERGVQNEEATSADLAAMAAHVEESLVAGAAGFSTSRVLEHQSVRGGVVPGTYASEAELLAIAEPLRRRRQGLLQMVPRGLVGGIAGKGVGGASDEERLAEARIAANLSMKTGRPLTYSVIDDQGSPGLWRKTLEMFEAANQRGAQIHPQVSSRGVGTLTGFTGSHLFQRRKSYLPLAKLPIAERITLLRRPEVRAAILADEDVAPTSGVVTANRHLMFARLLEMIYPFDDSVGPEPSAAQSVAALARTAGSEPQAYLYDYLLRADGRQFAVLYAANYNGHSYDAVHEMMCHPLTVLGLSDAGAHVSVLSDASNPTFQLTFWGRDRQRGPTLPLEMLIKKQTLDTARMAGFTDRGTLEVGQRADLNVIDHRSLQLLPPIMTADLPRGGERLLQGAQGYRATFVNGAMTRWLDRDVGARPGSLLRGRPS